MVSLITATDTRWLLCLSVVVPESDLNDYVGIFVQMLEYHTLLGHSVIPSEDMAQMRPIIALAPTAVGVSKYCADTRGRDTTFLYTFSVTGLIHFWHWTIAREAYCNLGADGVETAESKALFSLLDDLKLDGGVKDNCMQQLLATWKGMEGNNALDNYYTAYGHLGHFMFAGGWPWAPTGIESLDDITAINQPLAAPARWMKDEPPCQPALGGPKQRGRGGVTPAGAAFAAGHRQQPASEFARRRIAGYRKRQADMRDFVSKNPQAVEGAPVPFPRWYPGLDLGNKLTMRLYQPFVMDFTSEYWESLRASNRAKHIGPAVTQVTEMDLDGYYGSQIEVPAMKNVVRDPKLASKLFQELLDFEIEALMSQSTDQKTRLLALYGYPSSGKTRILKLSVSQAARLSQRMRMQLH